MVPTMQQLVLEHLSPGVSFWKTLSLRITRRLFTLGESVC